MARNNRHRCARPDGQRSLVLIADSEKGSGGLTQEYVKVILLQ